ncbi:hypothetical protein PAPYR_9540 [Paratrimastix pyriformis]|uniref:Uncharacterized protein n=1 Tax=Paratrimastix pyriformis TaxID=342808 RepID=A0ABQ8UDT3_9EUKA|nr:hypothetical protein PAPYR_9540 [Paratrimastix pyriformis]
MTCPAALTEAGECPQRARRSSNKCLPLVSIETWKCTQSERISEGYEFQDCKRDSIDLGGDKRGARERIKAGVAR